MDSTYRLKISRYRQEPAWLPRLFSSPGAAWIWLPVRLFVGYQWLVAGSQKLRSPAWMAGGQALQAFWQRAVNLPPGLMPGAVYYPWYHAFLRFMLVHGYCPWFAKLVAFGETSVGVLLLLGAFTGVAAGAGAFLNFNYMLAGSTSAGPVLFALEFLLVLAWRVAGRIGLDAVLLGHGSVGERLQKNLVPAVAGFAPRIQRRRPARQP